MSYHEWFHQLEAKQNMKIGVENMDDEVDKSIAMIGGFGDEGIEEDTLMVFLPCGKQHQCPWLSSV